MSQDSRERRAAAASLFATYERGSGAAMAAQTHALLEDQVTLLREALASLDRNNELIEELLGLLGTQHKQRANDLQLWKQANPELARSCHRAAEALSQVQVAFLDKMTEEINDSVEGLIEGEFLLTEFVDRFGPRLAHLNGVIQVLSQLSSLPNPTDSSDASH